MRKPPLYTAEKVSCTIFSGDDKESVSETINRTPYKERAKLIESARQYPIPSTLGKNAMTLVEFGDRSSGRTIVYGAGFLGNPTTTAAQLEIAEMANAWRDEEGNPASILTLPTSSMKKSVAHKILETGSFSPIAEEIAPELDRHLNYHNDQAGVVGHSFGSRLAAAIPSVLNNPETVKFTSIDDAPSWQKPLGIAGIAAAQLTETLCLSKYVEYSHDPEARKAWQNLNDGEDTPAVPLLVQLRDVIAMSRSGFVEDLENSLSELKTGTTVTLFAPELSRMNDNNPENIRELIIKLSQKFPGLDIRGVLVEGSTHNISAANPAYFGRMVELCKPRDNLQS